jgi:hypothetical protein
MLIISNDADASFVIPNQSTRDSPSVIGVKRDSIANREVEHTGVSPHLMREAQPFNDFLVELNQFSLGELIDVDVHGLCSLLRSPTLDG